MTPSFIPACGFHFISRNQDAPFYYFLRFLSLSFPFYLTPYQSLDLLLTNAQIPEGVPTPAIAIAAEIGPYHTAATAH